MIPRVSVGLPVYNGERFLPETLDSILKQTFRDWELIISDNASTDHTRDICLEYAQRDRRVRYYRNDRNLGSAKNFNRTVELARGEYFKSASADDLCGPELLARSVPVLDTHHEVVLCYARTTLIDENGQHLGPYQDRLDLRSPKAVQRFRDALSRSRLINVLQGLTRLGPLRQTGLLGGYVGSDVVLVVELALHGQFHELPQWLFFRRMHSAAFSSLTSLEERQLFVDPSVATRSRLHFWRHYREYMRVVARAPASWHEKAQLIYTIARGVIASRRTLGREIVETLRRDTEESMSAR